MEETTSSAEVVAVIPDVISETEENIQESIVTAGVVEARSIGRTTRSLHPVAMTTNVSGVPVSLPVGSIINVSNSSNGTTFNVITSDQIHVSELPGTGQIKQMLCVDNGFICEPREKDPLRWNGELKATHIVIQNSDENESTGGSSQQVSSWSDSANMAVLPVRCKNTNAELYKNRFGSGGRGRCIKLGSNWYTPSEFEALCGRASSKDWKRSIRFGGRSLQTLIDNNILRVHATSCTCSACCDDENATGPIRLFIPYKRRKRNKDHSDNDESRTKHAKHENSRDESNNDDSDGECLNKESWPHTYVAGEGLMLHCHQNSTGTDEVVPHQQENGLKVESRFHKLDELSAKLLKLANEFKKVVEEYKAEEAKTQPKEPIFLNSAEKNAEVIETVGLQPSSDGNEKRCANCNREALAECSLCRRTPYCSTFCQRKDWSNHQVECVRDATGTVMLIVEGSAPHDQGQILGHTADDQ